MKVRAIRTLVAVLAFALEAHAQTRPLPILEVNPDARTAAMGNVMMGEAKANYLYVNPTSLLYQDSWITVSASGEMYPKIEQLGRLLYGNASAGVRLGRHAIYVGYRYLGGLEIQREDRFGVKQKSIKPMDMTYDLGYAFRINDQFAVYATGTLTQAYVTRVGYATTFGLGAHYRTTFGQDPNNPYRMNLGLRLSDVGTPLTFSAKKQYAMPSSVALGGDVSRFLGEDHEFTVALGSRYYFLPSDAKLLTAGLGAEYTFRSLVSLRAGYEFAQRGMSHWTMGAGVSYSGLRLDLAYKLASQELGVSTMSCSLSFDL